MDAFATGADGLAAGRRDAAGYAAQFADGPAQIRAVSGRAADAGSGSLRSHMPAVSGAGHDAVYMARLLSSGMVFIPCKDGISHNEIESATPEDIEAGCNVLLHAMLARAKAV